MMCALPNSGALSFDSGPRTGPSGATMVVFVKTFGSGSSNCVSVGPRNEVSVNARHMGWSR
jgi:hypothetical protein